MGKGAVQQVSFLGGEWSKQSQSRLDLPMRKNAMAACFNGIVMEEGSWTRRPGTRLAGPTRNGLLGRILGFSPDGTTPMTMEVTPGHLRFRFGTSLMFGPDSVQVTSISADKPAILTLAQAPPPYNIGAGGLPPADANWQTGDQVIFRANNATAAQAVPRIFNQRNFMLTRLSATTFSLTDPITGLPTDGAALNWPTSGPNPSVTVARILELLVPYTAADITSTYPRLVQSPGQATLLHPNYPPQIITAQPSPFSLQQNAFVPVNGQFIFTITPLTFSDGPYLDPSPTLSLQNQSNGSSGSVRFTVLSNVVNPVNNGNGFVSTDVGRLIRIHNEPGVWQGTPTVYADQWVVTYNSQYYVSQANSNEGNEPDGSPAQWALAPGAHTWTWGIITNVFGPNDIEVNIQGPPLMYYSTATAVPNTFAVGVYSNTTGYPSDGCYHEGRLWLGGCVPNRFDASMSNGFVTLPLTNLPSILFSPTDEINFQNQVVPSTQYVMPGVVSDNNGISYTLNSKDAANILWFQPNSQGIVAGTSYGEWLIQASAQNNVLTPTSIQAHLMTKYGCANIEPVNAGLTTVFVQRFGRRLFEYLADVFSGRFSGPNLSEQAKHITQPGILEIARQEELNPIIWARLADGTFAGTTYRRISLFASEPPKFNAWHRHALGSGRQVMSLCTGPSPDGSLETVTFLLYDPLTQAYNVEVMTNIFDEDTALTDAWFLDSAIVPCAAVTATVNGVQGVRLLGLQALGGKTVTVFLAGLNCGSYQVANNSIFVPFGSDPDGLFTLAWLARISTNPLLDIEGGNFTSPINDLPTLMPINLGALNVPCVVGFPYVSQGQLLRPEEPLQQSDGPLLGKTRRTHMVGLNLDQTVTNCISIGTALPPPEINAEPTTQPVDILYPIILADDGNNPLDHTELFSGVYWTTVEADFNFDNGIAWQCTGPWPATVVSVNTFVQAEDR